MRRGKTRAQDLLVLERRLVVFRLKQSGCSYDDIVEVMQSNADWQGRLPTRYGRGEVYRDVRRELLRLRQELGTEVEEVRQEELARLDRLQSAIWTRALGSPANLSTGDPATPADLHAMDRVLDIMQQRARLLGLYASDEALQKVGEGLASLLAEAQQWQVRPPARVVGGP